MVLYRRYLRELVAAKATDRADDFASALLEIHDEDPDALAQEDIASILFSLSFAGHETTNNLIGNCVRRLLEFPERWDRLVAHPDLIPGAVDEILRFDPSVPVWRRVTTRAVNLGGVDLPEGGSSSSGSRPPAATPTLPRPGHVRSRAPELPPHARVRPRHPLLHRLRARAVVSGVAYQTVTPLPSRAGVLGMLRTTWSLPEEPGERRRGRAGQHAQDELAAA